MKKLISMVFVLLIMCSQSAFAANSTVSVKNNDAASKPVTYIYDSAGSGETVKSIKSLMTKLDSLSYMDSVIETLTVTSKSQEGVPVNIRLRLSLPEQNADSEMPTKLQEYSDDDYRSLGYYNLKVTDANGSVIYDGGTDAQKDYRDIPLSTMNTESVSENRIFIITISANKKLKNIPAAAAAMRLDWSVVTDTYPRREAKEDGETAENDSVYVSAGGYIAGEQIPTGKLYMTGRGIVRIYATDGTLRTAVALKTAGDTDTEGVEEYAVTLEEGEMAEVRDEVVFSRRSGSGRTADNDSIQVKSRTRKENTAAVAASVCICVAILSAGVAFAVMRKKRKG